MRATPASITQPSRLPMLTDATHDPNLRSWVESANAPGCPTPIQNLPYARFRRAGSDEAWRIGVAIGEQILDLALAARQAPWGADVDALLAPQVYLDLIHDPSLRAIVDALLAGVRMADEALVAAHGRDVRDAPGFRTALIDLGVTANAAITAVVLARAVDCAVTYGVFSLTNRRVGITGPEGWQAGLMDPPDGDRSLTEILHWGAVNAEL